MLPITKLEETIPKLGVATFFIGCHSSKVGHIACPESMQLTIRIAPTRAGQE
jgi:hypothetical protein